MPIAQNRYYSDPNLARAFDNIAQMFLPPGGSDLAGYAAANATKQKADALAQLLANPNDPDADRKATFLGAYNPAQSWRALELGDATQRYGYDTQAATSRNNNAADNERALRQTALDNQGASIRHLYDPLDPGQIRPAVSADIMGLVGLPAIDQVSGAPKPLSEDELKGAIFSGLPDAQKRAIVFGSTPLDVIANGDGTTTNVLRPDAIGKTPAPKDNGVGMSVTLPDGTVVQQGGKPMTEAQGKLANYVTTAKAMNEVLARDGNELTSTAQGLSEAAPTIGTVNPGNYMQSAKYQNARNAGERFVQSILRNESGAATPDKEIEHYQSTMLPRPGDTPEVLKTKAWLRQVAVNAMEAGMTLDARKAQIDAAIKSGPPPGFTDRPANGGGVSATGSTEPARPQTQQDFDALPSGAIYVDPEDGKRYRKP